MIHIIAYFFLNKKGRNNIVGLWNLPDFQVPWRISSPERKSVWPGEHSWSSLSCHHSNWRKSPRSQGRGKLTRAPSQRLSRRRHCRWCLGSNRRCSHFCSLAAPCAAWTASSATARTRMKSRMVAAAEQQVLPQQPCLRLAHSLPGRSSRSGPAVALWPPGSFFGAPCALPQEGCSRSLCQCGLELCSSSGQSPDIVLILLSCCKSRWDRPRFYRCLQPLGSGMRE